MVSLLASTILPFLSTSRRKIEDIINAMFGNEVYIRTQINQQISDLCRLLKSMPRNTEPCQYRKITGHGGSQKTVDSPDGGQNIGN
ncbi:hypothetical protein B9Z55_015464 [Caenorhabditis nigoni]|uniref:Uncharacterized protein n=1 Tax=Caenorhabditis nigoni TaxID=1611254 RepID=A0A2G5UB47_9PELO|nr:hypothetical protein B9Z55_015464 [Caenorhabditis nigoni]